MAYNDLTDLNKDQVIDIGYKGYLSSFEYAGIFDSKKCYTYRHTAAVPHFEPTSFAVITTEATATNNHSCTDPDAWSGDYLNYVTSSRIDLLRKVLYGGKRIVDTHETIVERAFIPRDGHSWAKEYTSIATDGYDIRLYTGLNLPTMGKRHFLGSTTLPSARKAYTGIDPPPIVNC